MSKPLDEMSVKELGELKDSGYAICRYIDERRAQEAGVKYDNTPYDAKLERGEGVQGPR